MAALDEVTTLLLVGKTGNGKSSTANTIIQAGRPVTGEAVNFTVAHSFNSATISMEWQECIFDERKLLVVNTPDLGNPPRSNEGKLLVPLLQQTEEKADEKDNTKSKSKTTKKKAKSEKVSEEDWTKKEVKSWITQAGGKPSAVLVVIRCDGRYTAEEYKIYKQLKTVLGGNMKGNLVVVFTIGDFLKGEKTELEESLKNAGTELKEVLQDATNRYVVFDNKAGDKEKKDQVTKLLEVVKKITEK